MSEPWARAAAVEPEDLPGDLWEACVDETADLWSDLSTARHDAQDQVTRWSMHCDWLVTRIVILSKLAGVTDWDRIPTDLILDGAYAGIIATAGLDPGPEPTPGQLDDLARAARDRVMP